MGHVSFRPANADAASIAAMLGRLCGQVSDTREIVARLQRRNERGSLGAECVEGFPAYWRLLQCQRCEANTSPFARVPKQHILSALGYV